jgi:photosystem II stability/assembly factor-like uncharacterized protein
MSDFDFSGLRASSQAAFKTSFDDVVRRSRRRRRARTAGVVLAAAVVIAGTGAASVQLRPTRGSVIGPPGPVPVTTPAFIPSWQPSDAPPTPRSHEIKAGALEAGDLDHLYLTYDDCHYLDCATGFAATADRGATWKTMPPPVPRNAMTQLTAVAARTLVLSYKTDGHPDVRHWLCSTDGGAHWRAVTAHPVTVLPAGWRVLDAPMSQEQVEVLAADPVTGDLATLSQPVGILYGHAVTGLPPQAGLWVGGSGWPGQEQPSGDALSGGTQRPPRQGSTLQISHDGGRTWRQLTFPDAMRTDGDGGPGAPLIATNDGQTAYALGEQDAALVVYRTTDGGKNWQRTTAHLAITTQSLRAALSPDGTLTVQVGIQAPDNPAMYQSTDGGQTLHQVAIGPGASATPVPGGYAQSDWPNTAGVWLSGDGSTWSYVNPPKLP